MALTDLLQSSILKRCKVPLSMARILLTGIRHNKYPEYPVVVSEIASISRNKNEVFDFTAQVANFMDQCPWVFEYSFFGCMRKLADDLSVHKLS
jgi:hypothetical protein